MKFIIVLLLFALVSFSNNDEDKYLKRIFFNKEVDWKPVYVKNLKLDEWNSKYIHGDVIVAYQKALGYSYFRGIDVKRYKDHNIGFIIDDLSKDYKFITYEFSNFRTNSPNSYEEIVILFKHGENLIIELLIYAEPDDILQNLGTKRDIEALRQIRTYFATFIKIDLLKFYCQRKDMDPLLRKQNESKLTNLKDSLSKNVYDLIINAGIDYKCE